MRTTPILALLLALGATTPAQAVVGTSVRNGGVSSTCALVARTPKGEDSVFCSAALVAPKEARTAAHCFHRGLYTGETLWIKCGQKLDGAFRAEMPVESAWTAVATADRGTVNLDDEDADAARLLLAHEAPKSSGVKPTPLAPSPPQSASLKNCRAEGYGYNNEKSSGSLRRAPMDPLLVRKREIQLALVLEAKAEDVPAIETAKSRIEGADEAQELADVARLLKVPALVNQMDSGGPLYCRGNGKDFVVGIASHGLHFMKRNLPAGTYDVGSAWYVPRDIEWKKFEFKDRAKVLLPPFFGNGANF